MKDLQVDELRQLREENSYLRKKVDHLIANVKIKSRDAEYWEESYRILFEQNIGDMTVDLK